MGNAAVISSSDMGYYDLKRVNEIICHVPFRLDLSSHTPLLVCRLLPTVLVRLSLITVPETGLRRHTDCECQVKQPDVYMSQFKD